MGGGLNPLNPPWLRPWGRLFLFKIKASWLVLRSFYWPAMNTLLQLIIIFQNVNEWSTRHKNNNFNINISIVICNRKTVRSLTKDTCVSGTRRRGSSRTMCGRSSWTVRPSMRTTRPWEKPATQWGTSSSCTGVTFLENRVCDDTISFLLIFVVVILRMKLWRRLFSSLNRALLAHINHPGRLLQFQDSWMIRWASVFLVSVEIQ